MMNGDEDERQRQHDHPLVLVGRRRDISSARDAAGCRRTGRAARPATAPVALSVRSGMKRTATRRSRPHGRRARHGLAGCMSGRCRPQVLAQHVEQRDEDRQLEQQRQAGGERVDLVLLVELHHLLLVTLLVVLVLLLELLDLRRERCSACIDLNCLSVSGSSAARTTTVSAMIDRPQLEPDGRGRTRGPPRRRRSAAGGCWRRRRAWLRRSVAVRSAWRKRRCASTGSKPPWLHGLQRSSRQPASTSPRSMPNSRIACAA